jgi:hypothetical protein
MLSQRIQLVDRPIIRRGLGGHWIMNAMTGTTIADMSGNGGTGTAGAGATWSNEDQGCLQFNATYSGVACTDQPSTRYTIYTGLCCRIKPSNVSGVHQLIVKGGAYSTPHYVFRMNGQKLSYYFFDASDIQEWTSTNNCITNNAWNTIAFQHHWGYGAETIAYVNGVSQSGTWYRGGNGSSPYGAVNVGPYLGARDGSNTLELFAGLYAEARKYSVQLSAAELIAISSGVG